jgi:hypothetical protein
MKQIVYYCHAVNGSDGTCHILKAIYNTYTENVDIFKVMDKADSFLATLDTEGGLSEMALFDLCLDLIEEQMKTTNIVKASLSEEKSLYIK